MPFMEYYWCFIQWIVIFMRYFVKGVTILAIKRVLKKIVSGSVISSMLFFSILCYSPFLPQVVAASVEHRSSSILPFLQGLRNQTTAYDQQVQTYPNSQNETQNNISSEQTNLLNNDHINQTDLSQEEIDKIVNDHTLDQNTDNQAANQVLDEEALGITNLENPKIDRFIVKYKNENQKEETVQKVRGNLKERIHTRNKQFDVYVTNDKMKKEDFTALIKEKNADTNIEYIQPDYQVTVASVKSPQENEKLPAKNISKPEQQDNTLETAPSDTQTQVDTKAPLLSKLTFDGLKIHLTYDEILDNDSLPTNKDFSVKTMDEKKAVIDGLEIKGDNLVITLATPLADGESIMLSYTPGTNPVQDQAGNPAEAISQKEITKQSEKLDNIAPVLQSATLNTATLELSYDKQLQEDSLPSDKDFSLFLNEKLVTKAIKSITITGEKLIIILNSPVTSQDKLILSYTPGKIALQDLAGNRVPEIKGTVVKNITPTVINDLRFAEQWALLSNNIDTTTNIAVSVGIDAVNAYQESEGDGVVVAVMDSGIDITHEDLKANIWTNQAEIPDNGIDDDGNGYVDDVQGWNFAGNNNAVHNPDNASDEWHGTHVAGIIAAEKGNQKGIAGVAPKSKIMPLQVFKNGTAYTSDIISAIQYAQQNGAQVVNCSWGTTSENIALKEAIEESGLLFVAAAGNSNKDIDVNPVYPGSLTADNIISVASINKTGNLSRFSNYGQNSVDVAAPGEEIISTTPGNNYGESGGTSLAAAFVTGEVALILSKYPNASLREIRTRIIASSDKLSSLTGKVSGSGKINCDSALANPIIPNDNIIQIIESVTKNQWVPNVGSLRK